MRRIFPLIALFTFTLTVFAQENRKVVFWSGDPVCGWKNSNVTDADKYRCETLQTERGTVSAVHHNGISLAIAFLDNYGYSLAAARIQNSTSEPLAFDSDNWGAAHYKTRAGFFAGEKPILAESSIPSRDLVRLLSTGTKLDNSLDTFMGDVHKTTEIRELRRPDGTRVRKAVIADDREAQEAAISRNTTRSAYTTNEQRRIRDTAITQKSVGANSALKGLVYFRRVKKAKFVMFSVSLDDTTYVFLLPKEK